MALVPTAPASDRARLAHRGQAASACRSRRRGYPGSSRWSARHACIWSTFSAVPSSRRAGSTFLRRFGRWATPSTCRWRRCRASSRSMSTMRGMSRATLAASTYLLDGLSIPPRLVRCSPTAFPRPGRNANGIEVSFVCGHGSLASEVPAPLRHAILLLVAHWYENREPVVAGIAATRFPDAVIGLLGHIGCAAYDRSRRWRIAPPPHPGSACSWRRRGSRRRHRHGRHWPTSGPRSRRNRDGRSSTPMVRPLASPTGSRSDGAAMSRPRCASATAPRCTSSTPRSTAIRIGATSFALSRSSRHEAFRPHPGLRQR